MPCYDNRGETSDYLVKDLREAQSKLNTVTRLLCKATARLADNDLIDMYEELGRWYRAHQKVDAKRKVRRGKD